MRLIDADAYAYPGDLKYEPTIEAEPVKHGLWIEGNDEYGMYLECSVCREDFVSWEADCARTNYCPNCGAKMDKEGA